MLDLALFRLYSTRMMRLLEVEGLENFDRADRMGRGMILVGTHLGAFVIRLAVMTRLRRPYTPVMLHPEDSTVGGYVKTLALHGKELGCDPSTPVLWARRGVMGAIKEQLSRGKRVYIAIDVGGKRVVKFLGRPTALADGIGRLALDTGAPVVPFTLLRGSEPLSLRLSVRPPLRFSLGGNREEDVQSIMTEVAAAGERMILEAPGQWMGWFGLAHWWKEAEKRDG
jgi:lauroyl/myristoyl acyltransferase